VDGGRAFHVSEQAGGCFVLDGNQLRQGFAALGDDQMLVGGGDFVDQFQAFGLEFRCTDVHGVSFVTISIGHGRPPVFRGQPEMKCCVTAYSSYRRIPGAQRTYPVHAPHRVDRNPLIRRDFAGGTAIAKHLPGAIA
jgi:hypothetical protein